MSWSKCSCVLLLVALAWGCSKTSAPPPTQAAPSSANAKAALKHVADTGEVGSGLDDVRTYLEDLKKSDAAKADPLLKDLGTLSSKGGNPGEAKAKAKELMEKL